ncbi:MAG: nitroreductase family protein [Actinomycetota bacterium]
MEAFEAIRTMLAVRSYRSDPIPDEVVHRIVEAGRLTGSAKNAQPWHFVVVREREAIEKLASMAPTGPYLAQAPVAVVVACEQGRFALSDASRAIQSMMLTAWADGVGSNWVGFAGMDHLKEPLGIPDELDVIGILPFGYPAQAAGKGKKTRRPLGEIAHRERFGQPFDG